MGALALSALLTAVTLRVPGFSWLAWVSLVPLFYAIRSGRVLLAVTAGAFWGACLHSFSAVPWGDSAAVIAQPSFMSQALLIAVPGIYAGLGALLTRWLGFNPFVLAVGWVLVEVSLRPLGLHQGLLAGTQSGVTLAHWIARLLGYVFVGFLVVCVNASLLAILSRARLRVPRARPFARLPLAPAVRSLLTSIPIPFLALGQAYPRAPPR